MDEDKMLQEIRLLTMNDDLPFLQLMDKIISKCDDLKERYLHAAEGHHLYNVCEYVVEHGITEAKIYNLESDIKLNGQLQISKRGISDSVKLISQYEDILYMQNGNDGLLVDVKKRITYKIPKLDLVSKFPEKLGIVASMALVGSKRKLLLVGEQSNRILGPIIYLIANPNHVMISENHISVIGPISTHMYIKDLLFLNDSIKEWLDI